VWPVVLVDATFVLTLLVSIPVAIGQAWPVWVLVGREAPETVRVLAPSGSQAGGVVEVSRSHVWPDVSATWASGEVTGYTADWRFALPAIVVLVWIAAVVLQERMRDDLERRARRRELERSRDRALADTVVLPAVQRP
jgi:hypothetical protein